MVLTLGTSDYTKLALPSIGTAGQLLMSNGSSTGEWVSSRCIQGVSFDGSASAQRRILDGLPTNCKNCGARIKASRCEYCDTRYN